MYIWLFSRSVGAGNATTRNTRGLTRSVIALIVPPLPAPSRPSKIRMTRRPLYLTQTCSLQRWISSFRSTSMYSLFLILGLGFSDFGLRWFFMSGILLGQYAIRPAERNR